MNTLDKLFPKTDGFTHIVHNRGMYLIMKDDKLVYMGDDGDSVCVHVATQYFQSTNKYKLDEQSQKYIDILAKYDAIIKYDCINKKCFDCETNIDPSGDPMDLIIDLHINHNKGNTHLCVQFYDKTEYEKCLTELNQ